MVEPIGGWPLGKEWNAMDPGRRDYYRRHTNALYPPRALGPDYSNEQKAADDAARIKAALRDHPDKVVAMSCFNEDEVAMITALLTHDEAARVYFSWMGRVP